MGQGCMTMKGPNGATVRNQGVPKMSVFPDSSNLPILQKKSHFAVQSMNTYIEASTADIDNQATKTAHDIELIIQALNSHFVFTRLTDEDKEVVADNMHLYKFNAGSMVFEQNRPARCYFVVRKGALEVLVNNKKVHKVLEGEGFGEIALLHECTRLATVRCLEKTELWGIEKGTFRKAIEDMNTQIYEQNREFLDKVTLLQPLSSAQKDTLAASLESVKYYSGQKIIIEGQPGQHLFIVKSGTVLVQKNGQEIRRLKSGNYFGELALLSNLPRSATCIAIEGAVHCLTLSREILQKSLGNQLQDILEKNTIIEAINKSRVLSQLTTGQKDAIIRELTIRSYRAGDVVISAGKSCKLKLYVIISGRLLYAKSSALFADKGMCVGDTYLVAEDQAKFEDDMIAALDMKVGEITIKQFEVSIGGTYQAVMKENTATNVLRKVHLFSCVDPTKLKDLFSLIFIRSFADGATILEEGVFNEHVYVVKRGTVQVLKDTHQVRTVVKYDYFGERAVLLQEASPYTYVASGKVSIWVIHYNDFSSLLTDRLRDQLVHRLKFEKDPGPVEQFSVIKRLGAGTFSQVFLVRTLNQLFALKVVNRDTIQKFALQERLLLEKHIILMMDHPFICKLVRTYKDSRRIYFLLEFINGLDLSEILKFVGKFSNNEAQFYIGCLILVLQYMHERDIMYRDLKLDNIMVDLSGYIKLIDFGTSKVVQTRTYTIVGTPHYMSPEVIIGKGYTKKADLWSLGIILYELLCGEVPFGENEEDPFKVYELILEMNVVYPEENDNPVEVARQLVQQLLSKFPENRGNFEELKKHEWFLGFDWEGLLSKQTIPPYAPDVADEHEILEEDFEEEDPWDRIINNYSEDRDEELLCVDPELEEFKSSIPKDWADAF